MSTGFVVALIDETPLEASKIKPIRAVLDEDEPALTREIIELCRWGAEYYIAPLGEMLRVALPANMAARGKREAVLVTDDALIEIARNEKRILDSDLDIIRELRKRPLPLSMLSRSTIERLRGAGIIATRDRLVDAKGVRYDRFVILESAGGALTEKQQSAVDLLQSRGGEMSVAALDHVLDGESASSQQPRVLLLVAVGAAGDHEHLHVIQLGVVRPVPAGIIVSATSRVSRSDMARRITRSIAVAWSSAKLCRQLLTTSASPDGTDSKKPPATRSTRPEGDRRCSS